ncbi:MAG TPA: hypothetical protein PLS20_01145 [Ruminococcus flavefaciens]|nr:hypothetical protein [Ruminococcus flavefaciens]
MKLPSINSITQQEFIDHIEDDDFLLKYGNPVAVNLEDGRTLMCMAIEYYERMTGEKVEIPNEIENTEEKK